MNKKIIVETKNSLPEELLVKKLLKEVLEKYDCPVFTDKVVIERDVIPHSHPVLTLGTSWFIGKNRLQYSQIEKEEASLRILENYLHEQFHWFLACSLRWREGIDYLKARYKDPGDCDSSKNDIIFWVHLAVIWNTRNQLQKFLAKDQVDLIYGGWRPYPKTEKLVKEKFKQLEADLAKFDLNYR